jgi:hypothetical protein
MMSGQYIIPTLRSGAWYLDSLAPISGKHTRVHTADKLKLSRTTGVGSTLIALRTGYQLAILESFIFL